MAVVSPLRLSLLRRAPSRTIWFCFWSQALALSSFRLPLVTRCRAAKSRSPGGRREKREGRREKRADRNKHDEDERASSRLSPARAGLPLAHERKERREEPCSNNEQLNCNCTATGFALSRVEQQREKREERREKREERREKREERREKRKERREKREEITKKAARDPQID